MVCAHPRPFSMTSLSGMTMKPRNKLLFLVAPLAVALPLALTGCGAGSESGSGRPTTAQLVTALTSGPAAQMTGLSSEKLPTAVIKCIAQKFEDSGITDAGLRSIVNGDKNYKPTGADNSAVSKIESQMTSCVTAK